MFRIKIMMYAFQNPKGVSVNVNFMTKLILKIKSSFPDVIIYIKFSYHIYKVSLMMYIICIYYICVCLVIIYKKFHSSCM